MKQSKIGKYLVDAFGEIIIVAIGIIIALQLNNKNQEKENQENLLIHNYKNIYTGLFLSTYYKFKKDTLYIEASISGRTTYINTKN